MVSKLLTSRFASLDRWIDLFDEEEIIYKRIDYLKDRHWIDKQTKDITFSLLVFNGQYEPFVCEALLKFDFSRGMFSALYLRIANPFHVLTSSIPLSNHASG